MNGEKLREARKGAGLTQDELASQLGINRSTISKYESGIIDPPVSQLKKIQEILRVDWKSLVDDYDSSDCYYEVDYDQMYDCLDDYIAHGNSPRVLHNADFALLNLLRAKYGHAESKLVIGKIGESRYFLVNPNAWCDNTFILTEKKFQALKTAVYECLGTLIALIDPDSRPEEEVYNEILSGLDSKQEPTPHDE
jgi:transcriptional regulator with XRE-family HTH domain